MYGAVDALLRLLAVLGFLLLTVLILIWVERKVLGHIQMRLGPMRTGWHGWLQSVADAIKLLTKEDLLPATADRWAFQVAPIIVFAPAFIIYVAIPFTDVLAIRKMPLGLFFIVAISGFMTVGYVLAGWASNNKYSLLGGVRMGAQLVSYELPFVLAVLGVAMLARSLDLQNIVGSQSTVPYLLLQPVGFLLFITAALAEVNRTPFDIPVAESEVVGGPLVEYSGIRWGMFFFAEYVGTFTLALLGAILFLGGWNWPWVPTGNVFLRQTVGLIWLLGKTYALVLLVIWLRGTLPRLRIDQLMSFAWKLLIPLAFINLFITGLALVTSLWVLVLGWVAAAVYGYGIYTMQRKV